MPTISNYKEQVTRALGATANKASATEVRVLTTDTELFRLSAPGIYRVWVKNTGGTALNACKLQGRNSTLGSWVDIATTATQYQDPASNNIGGFLLLTDSAVDPTTMAGSGEWNGTIDATWLIEVRMVASVASGSTSVKSEVA